MIGVLGHDSALLRLYWAGDNLGELNEFCYEWKIGIVRHTLSLSHTHTHTPSLTHPHRELEKE